MWHVSSSSGVATLRTAIHLLLTYPPSAHQPASGTARNFRPGVRQPVAFLSVHSRSAALPSRPYNRKTSWRIIYRLNDWTNNDNTITLRNHIPKNYVFSRQGVRTPLTPLVWLRHGSQPNVTHRPTPYHTDVRARARCRISPPRFMAECCKRQLNQGSFRLSTFSDLY